VSQAPALDRVRGAASYTSGRLATTVLVRFSTADLGIMMRLSQLVQRRPMSAPSLTTSQSFPPQGCAFFSRSTSPVLSSVANPKASKS
jgi:hypothetical protein